MKATLLQTKYTRNSNRGRWNLDSQETITDYSTELFKKRIIDTVDIFKDRGFTQNVSAWCVESITPDKKQKVVFELKK